MQGTDLGQVARTGARERRQLRDEVNAQVTGDDRCAHAGHATAGASGQETLTGCQCKARLRSPPTLGADRRPIRAGWLTKALAARGTGRNTGRPPRRTCALPREKWMYAAGRA